MARHPLHSSIHVDRLAVGDEFCLVEPSEHLVVPIKLTDLEESRIVVPTYGPLGREVTGEATGWLASSH
ncbi:MAG TPA: hypothetical protein VFX16_36765 [Pseudonocardiaceae bacterium]|nr:hypothetical protein [Pseudonocardiaceae bacterium]